jgi:RHS repeat-associated protein
MGGPPTLLSRRSKNLKKQRFLSILIGVLTIASAEAFVGSPAHAQTGPVPIPPIVSPPTRHKPATVDRDFSQPSAIPTSTAFGPVTPPTYPSQQQGALKGYIEGISTEILSERKADTKIFRNPDATLTARVYSGPVHYRDASGAWQDIDTSLIASGLNRFKTSANSISAEFAADPTDPNLAKLVLDGSHSLSFGLDGVSQTVSVPAVVGSTITYPRVFPQTDLKLTAQKTGIKEEIVLASKDAPESFVFPLGLQGLTAEIDPGGDVVYRDATGAERAHTPTGAMEDSNVDPHSGDGAVSSGVSYQLIPYGAETALKVTLDRAWLDDPARVYPVKVDPPFTANTSEDDTYVMSGFHADYASDTVLKVGTYDGGSHKGRAFMHFDGINNLNGKAIISATIYTWENWAWSCSQRQMDLYRVTQGWGGHSMQDFPGASYGDWVQGANFAMGYSGACPQSWAYWDITGSVRNWTGGAWANSGVVFKAANEADNYGWKKFNSYNAGSNIPHIDVNYDTAPNVASPTGPGNGAQVHTLTPTISVSGSDPDGDAMNFKFYVCSDPGMSSCWIYGWTPWPSPNPYSLTLPAGLLDWNRTYWWNAYSGDNVIATSPNWTWSFTTSNSPPNVSLSSPADTSVITTTTPVLSATGSDPDGDSVTYDFKVSTGSDGSGLVVESGYGNPTWTLPAGTVTDGRTYYWSVAAKDSTGDPSGQSTFTAPWSFKVDQRLGIKPQLPYDTLGPATVNLGNGNAVVQTSSPSFKTVGGPIGLSYTYNSQKPYPQGLTGYYFNDNNANAVFDSYESASLIRTDPQVNFDWGNGSPYPSINTDHFLVRWAGYISVPYSGSYTFGAIHDDGVRAWIGNPNPVQVIDRWNNLDASPVYGASITLTANQPTKITLEYYEWTGPAYVKLWASGPFGSGGTNTSAPVDASWLTTDVPGLPDGWSFSADPDGGLSYASARISDKTVVFADATGATHTWTWSGSAWAPPPGEDGVLGNDASTGLLTLHAEDGRIYSFRADGTLASVSSAPDDLHPAATVYTYSGTPDGSGPPARLSAITDPVSNRAINLSYGGDTSCPAPLTGYDTSAPPYMLCKVDYSAFNGGETDLYYSNKHLARIADPGGATTDFGYDGPTGKLTQIRDSLNNDLIASGAISDGASDTHKTLIAYDSQGRATSITASIPDSSAANRPAHRFDYQSSVTLVHVDGISGAAEPNGYARRVALDNTGRAYEEKDVAGKATSYTWDASDHLLKTVDPTGIQTTHIYDPAGRETDTYGPGAASEFTGYTSLAAPHSITNYDEGINGLAAAWWANKNMSGPALRHSTSAAQEDWAAGSPDPAIPPDNFSGRLTGEVNLPSAGGYTFNTIADGARLYVDDKKIIDRWAGPYSSEVASDQPTSYWRLGEVAGQNTAVDSAGGNYGTYNGGMTLGVTSTAISNDSDTAATFDGTTGYVQILNSTALNPSFVTVEAWVKSNTATWNTDGFIVSHRNAYILHPDVGTKTLRFYISDGTGWPGAVWTAPASFDLTVWHDYAGTFDGSTIKLYADGAEVASAAFSGTINTSSTNPIYIGRDDPSAGARFGNASIDEVSIYPTALSASRISAHYNAGVTPNYSFTSPSQSLTAGAHRIRIDYQELLGGAQLKLNVSPSAGVTLKPRYNLVTSRVDPDGKKTSTQYATPHLGLPTSNSLDPQGLNLTSTTSYEPAGTGYFRRTSRTLPSGAPTTVSYSYFGATETADNPCTTPVEATNQAGALKTETDADPDGGGPQTPIAHEYRYDEAGRVVAQRVVGDANWTCTAYDSRGRVTSQKDSSGKTTSFDYSNPAQVTTSYTDSSGGTRTTVSKADWLGRALSYTDENATITRTTYDQPGRATATYRTFSGQAEAQLTGLSYDNNTGRLASITEYASGTGRTTTFSYDDAGRLTSTTKPNGVVTTNTIDANRGWLNSISNKKNANELSPWTYTRSSSGKVASEATTGRTRNFTFDAAGRLTQTVEGATTRNYSYDLDSNRCSTSTSCNSSYVYDNADRLTASPFATGHAYDSHGNLISANPITQPPAGSLNQSFAFDAGSSTASQDYPVIVGQNGTLSTTLDWTPSAYRTGSPSGSMAPGATATSTVNVAGSSNLASSLTWTQGFKPQTSTFNSSVTAAGINSHSISPSATGAVTASLDWNPATTSFSDNAVYIPNPTVSDGIHTHSYPITVGADGTISASLNWSAVIPSSNLDLDLYDSAGNKVASSDSLLGNSESISYGVTGLGYPATATYTLKVTNWGPVGLNYNLSVSYPITTNLDLELYNPSNVKVASSYSTTAKPETLSYPNAPPGAYTLKVVSADYAAGYTLSSTYKVTAPADLTMNIKNPSGATVATARSATGSSSLTYLTPSGGNYTLELVNNSPDTDVPSYSESWSLNSTMTLALKDTTGAVIQQDTSSAKPKTVTRTVTPGRYTISATPTGGVGTATVTASYPGRPAKEVIGYDANDHPTSVDDGTNTTSETLSPSGRLLRRVVTDDATGAVSEDTTFGYDGPGDSPAYSKPTAGGAVTTYFNGPGGLLVIDTAGTPTYPIQNGHGDNAGTTDANGVFTANPVTDEWGVGQTPANRLGWLGGKERFSTGGSLGLVRMGVRLYDPSLGRFLEVDSVEGGSANDYDYAWQDPINNFDLDGRFSCKRNRICRGARYVYRHVNVSYGGCIAVCVTASFAHGHLYASGGCCGLLDRGVGVGWTSVPPEKQRPVSVWGCKAAGLGACTQGGLTKENTYWYGFSLLIGGAGWGGGDMYTFKVF